ncbi:nucleotidyltransferase domain-containing protein [Zavarzinia compransoris]|uniref:DNA polymerase III subunit beta n=1 Tax=Zavarzinia compransoris TaxID=1264899 RepID=A0A317EEL1_9PROT|nr:nucleotidyltransferase domain-containing protein [Zavarzinia compransoris]PWR23803.1 DNA polymerase III subunit beta [Zavarzinia compransoris]TDP48034.1 putative nucleotidyltransferase [Zavarzinia compransoris]
MRDLDPVTEHAVRRFASLLHDRYEPLDVIVYGSRARGTHRPDSDADVAVILGGDPQRFVATKLDMSDIAYDILLETGVNISPLPIWLNEWARPEDYSNPQLLENIAREGVRL